MSFYTAVEELTKKLVAIPSVVTTTGEEDVAQFIHQWYGELDYFNDHPEHLSIDTVGEEGMRSNVLAMVRGTGEDNGRTVVLVGHLDTVGVEDFGDIKKLAFDSENLMAHIADRTEDEDVLKDLESGEYLFGRGALDMKSGVAIHMNLIKYFSEHPEELNGTLISIAECDEEGNAEGIVAAIDTLLAWKDTYQLDFIGAINSDYSTPSHKEDEKKALYFGSIGKLLPTFFIVGKEAHVGAAFDGFDANLLLSNITRQLDYNPDFTETNLGEVAMPPVSLLQRDYKAHYDVQTPLFAYGYYNYFSLGKSPDRIMSTMKDVAKRAFDETIKEINTRYHRFCQLRGQPYEKKEWDIQVYTWEEFYGDLATIHGEKFHSYMRIFGENLKREQPEMDIRDFAIAMIKEAWMKWSSQEAPAVIVCNSSTYYAPVVLDESDTRHKALLEAGKQAMERQGNKYGEDIEMRMFYPYISDSSFLYIPKDQGGLRSLKRNTPSWGFVYEHPTRAIEQISMPVMNIGTWGKDGHKFTERVEKRYTFEVVPEIIRETILTLLD